MGVIWSCLYNFRNICALTPCPFTQCLHTEKGQVSCGACGVFQETRQDCCMGAALDSLSHAFVFTGKALFLQKVSGVLLPSTELTVGSLAACNRKVL